jgi:hypothetical protein
MNFFLYYKMASQFITPHQARSEDSKEYKQVERRSVNATGFLPLINQRKTPLEDYKTFERATWDISKSHEQNKRDIKKMFRNIHPEARHIRFAERPAPPHSTHHGRSEAIFELPPVLQGINIHSPKIVSPPPPARHPYTFSSPTPR